MTEDREFEQCWARNQRFVRRWACRLARRFGGRPNDYLGYLTLRLIRRWPAYQRAKRSYGFMKYFAHGIYSNVVQEVLRYESERWAQFAAHASFATDPVRAESLSARLTYPDRDQDGPVTEALAVIFELLDDEPTGFWRFLCAGLTPRARQFVERRYRLEHSLKQIGEDENLSKEAVRLILQKALERIGRRLRRLLHHPTISEAWSAPPPPPSPRRPAKPKRGRRYPIGWIWRSVEGRKEQVFLRVPADPEANPAPRPAAAEPGAAPARRGR